MPIRPEKLALYPADGPAISRRIRVDRAKGYCEGCGAVAEYPHPVTGSIMMLTVAHLDHNPANCDPENLRAWCQKCHNSYDAPTRRNGIRERRARAAGQTSLW